MTHSPTPTERLALKTANAALLESNDGFCDLVATVVFALSSAQLLQSPETAAETERLRAEAEAAIRWIDEYTPQPATVPGAVVRVLTGLDRERRRLDAERTELWERVEKLRARVAELETERHTTNEWVTDAAAALRVAGTRIAELETASAKAGALHTKCSDSNHCQYDGERWPCQTLTHLQRPGCMAEQKHLMDPLDHALEALAPRNLPETSGSAL